MVKQHSLLLRGNEMEQSNEIAGEWMNLARRYDRLGDTEKTIECFKSALRTGQLTGLTKKRAVDYINLNSTSN